jgi:hypothetical protein
MMGLALILIGNVILGLVLRGRGWRWWQVGPLCGAISMMIAVVVHFS